MPPEEDDLQGSFPDASEMVLIVIDMINDFAFPGGEQLLAHALPAARRIAALKKRAHRAGVPVVYVNDNFGRWRSDFRSIIARFIEEDAPGRPVIELLHPEENDYFVLKPKHSGFYHTTLDTLLAYLHARTLILTGVSGDICVLFTAGDAYMRDFRLHVPADCTASLDPAENAHALRHMHRVLDADVTPSDGLRLPGEDAR